MGTGRCSTCFKAFNTQTLQGVKGKRYQVTGKGPEGAGLRSKLTLSRPPLPHPSLPLLLLFFPRTQAASSKQSRFAMSLTTAPHSSCLTGHADPRNDASESCLGVPLLQRLWHMLWVLKCLGWHLCSQKKNALRGNMVSHLCSCPCFSVSASLTIFVFVPCVPWTGLRVPSTTGKTARRHSDSFKGPTPALAVVDGKAFCICDHAMAHRLQDGLRRSASWAMPSCLIDLHFQGVVGVTPPPSYPVVLSLDDPDD